MLSLPTPRDLEPTIQLLNTRNKIVLNEYPVNIEVACDLCSIKGRTNAASHKKNSKQHALRGDCKPYPHNVKLVNF